MTVPGAEGGLTSPAAMRNRGPILAVLRRVLPARGTVLEIATGTGEHAAYFAAALPHLTWQPTDVNADALASIAAHRRSAQLPNLLLAIALDATSQSWPVSHADAVVAINMIHVAAWRVVEGLMAGAARTLAPGGIVYLYGPFKEEGRHTAPSNAAFDASLRAGNPEWGVRDLGEVAALARRQGLALVERVTMPANNLSVVLQRQDG